MQVKPDAALTANLNANCPAASADRTQETQAEPLTLQEVGRFETYLHR